MTSGCHWKWFIVALTTNSTSSAGPVLLKKSQSDWSHLRDMATTLLRQCPVARTAVLGHLTPLFVSYFVTWWQRVSHKSKRFHGSNASKKSVDINLEELGAIENAEITLRAILKAVWYIVSSPETPDNFRALVCVWCLARLRPACAAPPTQLLSNLISTKRSQKSHTFPNSSISRRSGTHTTDQSASQEKAHDRVRPGDKRRFDQLRPQGETANVDNTVGCAISTSQIRSDCDSSSSSSDSDPGAEYEENRNTEITVGSTTTGTIFSNSSSTQLNELSGVLGSWCKCPLITDLLQMVHDLLLGDHVSLATVQALLLCATVPDIGGGVALDPVVVTTSSPSAPSVSSGMCGFRPTAYSVLPHWVIVYLLRTAVSNRLERSFVATSTTRSPIRRLINLTLEAALHPPPSWFTTGQKDVFGATGDTVSGYINVDPTDPSSNEFDEFWTSCCLNHLLFLGDESPSGVAFWVSEKLKLMNFRSLDPSNLSLLKRFAYLLLCLGNLGAPTPPKASSISNHTVAPFPYPPTSGRNPHYSGLKSSVFPFNFPPPTAQTSVCGPPTLSQPPPPLPTGPSPSFMSGFAPHPRSAEAQHLRRPGQLMPYMTSLSDQVDCSRLSADDLGVLNESHGRPLRQPPSLIWILSLSQRIRSVVIEFIADKLRHLSPLQLMTIANSSNLSPALNDARYVSMAVTLLLTAPAGSAADQLLLFLLNKCQSPCENSFTNTRGEEEIATTTDVDKANKWLAIVCCRLLRIVCYVMRSTVFASSETCDSLNRGGCEGILRAAQSLVALTPSSSMFGFRPSVNSKNDSIDGDNFTGNSLFYYLCQPISSASVASAQLLSALTQTLEPGLAVHVLLQLCSIGSNTVVVSKQKSAVPPNTTTTTRLSLFFLFLDELEFGWMAKIDNPMNTGFIHNTTVLRYKSGSIQRSVLFEEHIAQSSNAYHRIHQLLSDDFLPAIWRVVSTASSCDQSRFKALSFLAGLHLLLEHENMASRSRLLLALTTQSQFILPLLCTIQDLEILRHLFTLFEYAVNYSQKTNSRSSKSDELSRNLVYFPVKSLAFKFHANRRLAALVIRLLDMLERRCSTDPFDTPNIDPVMCLIQLIHQTEYLLRTLCCCDRSLPCSSVTQLDTLHTLITAAIQRSLSNLDHKTSIERGNSVVLSSTLSLESDSLLLTADPTTRMDGASDYDLSCGYLRKSENRLRYSKTKFVQKHSTLTSLDHLELWQPTNMHLLRIISSMLNHYFCSVNETEFVGIRERYVYRIANSFQQTLLPNGLYIPQTSLITLPVPLTLITPATGVCLERVLHLLCRFSSELSSNMKMSFDRLSADSCGELLQTVLYLLLDETFNAIAKQISENNIFSKMSINIDEDTIDAPENSIVPSDVFRARRSLLPCPRLLLSLLLGLESAWSSPTAPRHSVSKSIAYMCANDFSYAQGAFPVFGAGELGMRQARQLVVDYGQRRVDTRSMLFQFTKYFVINLFKICYEMDRVTAIEHLTADQVEPSIYNADCQSNIPLDRLMHWFTAREMTFLLTDVRRNLRLRMSFNGMGQTTNNAVAPCNVDRITLPQQHVLSNTTPFINPLLMLAFIQGHLVKPGVSDLLGPLLNAVNLLHHVLRRDASADMPEEIDVDGELMVLVDD